MSLRLFALVFLFSTEAAAQVVKIAVVPTKLEKGAAGQVSSIVDDVIMSSVEKAGSFQVIGRDDINDLIGFEKQKQMLGCDDTTCMAELGGALGVDKLLVAKIDKTGSKWVVSTKVLDMKTTTVEARRTDTVSGDVDALLEAVPLLVAQLFAKQGKSSATCAGPDECNDLGDAYWHGRGRERDYAMAATLYAKACQAGHAKGCESLGWVNYYGQGVPMDYVAAAANYQKACTAGRALACSYLADCYYYGRGVPKDFVKAHVMYGQVCDRGEARGCSGDGWMYEKGEGVTADLPRARQLYDKGCSGGDAAGCLLLGRMHERGVGGQIDTKRASELYRRGCSLKNEESCTAAQQLSR